MEERLDLFEKHPSGMDAYLSNYGYHISKPMYLWAVSMMRDRNGNKARAMTKDEADKLLESHGVVINHNKAYDVPYVLTMARMDYLGSSLADEAHLAKYVKDYLDDVDGSPTRAFDEFYVNTIAKGIPINWEDMI